MILRRNVFYLHGFDPASTARYRRIFAQASARHGVEVADSETGGDGWTSRRDGVLTGFHYLRYEDLVRAYQAGGLMVRLGRGLRMLAGYVADGALLRLPRRVLALAVSPYAVALSPVIGLAIASWLSDVTIYAMVGVLALGAVLMLLHLKLILAADLFAYMRELAHGEGPAADACEDRLDALAREIRIEADETLIVGHSLGGVAAIRAAADLLDRLPEGTSFGLLTLGSVHGIVLAQRGAGRDRLAAAIARICSDPRVFWVDVSSPRDAFCVPLTDPLLQIGAAARTGMTSPRVISAPLAHAPRIPGDRRTLFTAMRRHMGYLLAAPEGAGFDYADTVTGTQTLAQRFGPRHNSPKARMWPG